MPYVTARVAVLVLTLLFAGSARAGGGNVQPPAAKPSGRGRNRPGTPRTTSGSGRSHRTWRSPCRPTRRRTCRLPCAPRRSKPATGLASAPRSCRCRASVVPRAAAGGTGTQHRRARPEQLGVHAGDSLVYEVEENGVRVRKAEVFDLAWHRSISSTMAASTSTGERGKNRGIADDPDLLLLLSR